MNINMKKEDRNKSIIDEFNSGSGYSDIARKYSVSKQRIYQIVRNGSHTPSELANIFLQAILRDDCKCQWGNSCCDATREKLVIHHIDKNPSNNCLSNLITLCVKCHVHFHALERGND